MKKQFRTTLFKGSNTLCETLIILAAKANGGNGLKMNQLYIVAEGQRLNYPSLNEDLTVELIDECTLHVDRKIGDKYETVCIIEEVEVEELYQHQTEDDLENVL